MSSTLSLSNFSIHGNGLEGDGIKIVADGADRSVHDSTISNVNVEHVGGIGLDVLGNVSRARCSIRGCTATARAARASPTAPAAAMADELEWVGGGFRKNGVAGLILDNGAHDISGPGRLLRRERRARHPGHVGHHTVEQSGFENNHGIGAIVRGSATFADDTFSTYGRRRSAIGGYLDGDQVILIGVGNEYYGAGADPTVLANLQGTGTLAIAGSGNVVVGPGIALAGGTPFVAPPPDTTAPLVSSITTSGAGILAGTGILNAGDVVLLTVALSEV